MASCDVACISGLALCDGFLSKANIDEWLRSGKMRYGTNVDITSYKDCVRKTHNVNMDGSGGPDEEGNPGMVGRCRLALIKPMLKAPREAPILTPH
jgi:hypothetical protein